MMWDAIYKVGASTMCVHRSVYGESRATQGRVNIKFTPTDTNLNKDYLAFVLALRRFAAAAFFLRLTLGFS